MKQPSTGKRKTPLGEKHRKFTEEWVRTGNAKSAANAAGFSEKYTADLCKHAGVLKYKAKLEERATEKAVKTLAIDRVFVLEGLARLAQLSPEDTKGTITGQVNAYTEIGEIIGLKIKLSADLTKQFEGKSREELEFFVEHGYYPDVERNQPRPN